MYASGEFRWFKWANSEKQISFPDYFSFLPLGSNINFYFILMEVVYADISR